MKNLHLIIIIFYFSFLLLLAPFNLLSFDTYYYWEWSRHLDISYYDGSPMIAYFIKLSTLFFGDTLFALSLVGIVSAALTSWLIYKTALFFLSKEASYIAMLLWLFSPLMTIDILKQTTYDTPLALFWALTLYFAVRFIKSNNMKDLYWVGASIGLMMLSKYSGVVLVLSLLIFLLTTPYRYLFKTLHFYLVLLLAMVIFSPVIIWNEQHAWQSFVYQLTTHTLKDSVNPMIRAIKSFFGIFLPSLNFMLITPFLYQLTHGRTAMQSSELSQSSDKFIPKVAKKAMIIRLCMVICITFLGFYLFTATKATIRAFWLTPYLISCALLGGFCFQAGYLRKSTFLLIAIYGIVSFGILINNTYYYCLITPKKLVYYRMMQQFNASYPLLPKTILTANWSEARVLFFLKNKPYVYTLGCDSLENQYALWSTDIVQKIKNNTLKEAVYIDLYNRVDCAEKYFDQCVRLPLPSASYRKENIAIYAYKCTNFK